MERDAYRELMFVHLHVHSNFSFCRGASRIEELVDAALARGMSCLGPNRHQRSLRPGMVPSVCRGTRRAADRGNRHPRRLKKRPSFWHATARGYSTLCRLVSQRLLESGFCLSRALLQERQHLIILSDAWRCCRRSASKTERSHLYVELNDRLN